MTRALQRLPRTVAAVVAAASTAGFLDFVAAHLAGQEPGAPGTVAETQLHWATGFKAVEAIRALIERGMDVNAEDSGGRTPLALGGGYLERAWSSAFS